MSGAIPHGGRLAGARRTYPSAPTPWLDLSTGINPEGWRRRRAPLAALARLPDPAEVAALEAAAARLRRWVGDWPAGADAIAMGIDF